MTLKLVRTSLELKDYRWVSLKLRLNQNSFLSSKFWLQDKNCGLEKLNRADPSVEYYVTKLGEHVLSTCGEVHLEKCLKDLKDDYLEGQVLFTTSEPIIPFRETCVNRQVRDKIRKKKQEFEEQQSESSSTDNEVDDIYEEE